MRSYKSALLIIAFAAVLVAASFWVQRKEEESPPASRTEEQAPSEPGSSTEQALRPAGEPEQGAPRELGRPADEDSLPVTEPEIAAPSGANQPAKMAPLVVSGPLRRSDVLLSPRRYRRDWLDALNSFSANRIVWTYSGEKLIPEAEARGIAVQCAIPFWVPKDNSRKDEMACVDPSGNPVVSDFVAGVFPDVNTDAWRRYVLGETKMLVDAGCTSFQQDGAWLNYQMAITEDGCHSRESQVEFEAYASSDARTGEPFDGRDTHQSNRGRGPDSAKAEFEAFQKQSTERYHEWLHGEIDAYAESKWPGSDTTFSGNFAFAFRKESGRDWLLAEFDFVLMEASGNRRTMPNVLRNISRETSKLADVSGVTIPRDDVWLNQRSIASAYALGLTAIVPWDVYVPRKPRFFGNPADFAPLLRLVRNNPALFDDYVSGEDFYGAEHGPVLPGQGTVTKVDRTTYPDRTTVFWSRGPSFREVAKNRQIVVSGVAYRTIVESRVGAVYLPRRANVSVGDPLYFIAGADSYLISVRRNMYEPGKRAVHAVSWTEKPVALYLHLRRSDFPEPPTMLVTPENPTPKPVEPRAIGDYYIYPVGGAVWAILY